MREGSDTHALQPDDVLSPQVISARAILIRAVRIPLASPT